MTFANPVFLAALTATAVPILLHLLARRALPGVPFSSLLFLRSIERSAVRWARVTQRWLLAIRIAILALTALALARPVFSPHQPPVSTVIVLDGSASMGAARGSVWRDAQDAALRLADSAPGPLELAVAGPGFRLEGSLPGPPAAREGLIRALRPTGAALDPAGLLAEAAAYAERVGGLIRLLLISDFQPDAWEDSLAVPGNIELWGIPIRGARGNLALGPVSYSGMVRGDGIIEIHGVVERSGETADSCQVTLVTPQGSQSTLVALTAIENPFSFRTWRQDGRPLEGHLVLDDPEGLVSDDRRAVFRWGPPRCRVGVWAPQGEARARLLAALDPEADRRWGFSADAASCDPPTTIADSCDVMLVTGATAPGSCADEIITRRNAGAGLILVADERRLTEEGRRLFSRTIGVTPARIRDAIDASPALDYGHPVLAPFRDLPPHGFGLPAVWRFWTSQGRGSMLIGLDDQGLLVEGSVMPGGRALALMTGIVPPWSDWGSRASFVPLIQLLVDYAAGALYPRAVAFGVTFTADIPWTNGGDPTLVAPDGTMMTIEGAEAAGGVARIRFGPFVEPGLYAVWQSGQPVTVFEPVVAATERAVGAAIRPAQVSRWLMDPQDDAVRTAGIFEPATLLLVLALSLLVGEAWLSLRITRGASPRATSGRLSIPDIGGIP